MEKKRLGDVLVERGSFSRTDLRAIALQQGKATRWGEIPLEDARVSRMDIAKAVELMSAFPDCPFCRIARDGFITEEQASAVLI